MNDLPSPDELKQLAALLRRPSGEHAEAVVTRMNEGNRVMNEAAIRVTGRVSGTILEIGMANGLMTSAILDRSPNANYIGCDISPEMVAAATTLNQRYVDSGRAEYILVEPGTLPANLSADIVLSVNTIYFWDDVADFLDRIKRTLSSGGGLILGFRPASSMSALPFVQYGFKTFSSDDVTNLLSRAGFKVEEIVEDREADRELFGKQMRIDHVIVKASCTE